MYFVPHGDGIVRARGLRNVQNYTPNKAKNYTLDSAQNYRHLVWPRVMEIGMEMALNTILQSSIRPRSSIA